MKRSHTIGSAVIEDIKSGALAVVNESLHEAIQKNEAFETWSTEDKAKFNLILNVRDEVLRRVNRTLERRRRTK